jgi:uncharacterized membrane protein SpoIIM required for sporulation
MVQTIEKHEMWTHSIVGIKPLASSAIMTNNMSVGFMTFALGITAGLGTIYMLLFNGLLIGVIGMACHLAGMSLKLWEFVAPHGVLELPAIFLAGGAGLRIASGLLFPGYLPRRESLVRAGSEAVQLLLGTIPILIVAGAIEAFVSPTGKKLLRWPSRWGLCLCTVDIDERPESSEATRDSWLFNDAPRNLRLRAIDHVPALVEALAREVAQTAKRVSEGQRSPSNSRDLLALWPPWGTGDDNSCIQPFSRTDYCSSSCSDHRRAIPQGPCKGRHLDAILRLSSGGEQRYSSEGGGGANGRMRVAPELGTARCY